MKLLPIIAWVINTTRPETLPRGITPYQVWFGREPPNWPELSLTEKEKDPLIRSHASANGSDDEDEEDEEELFAEGAEEELIPEAYILSELSQRVADYTLLVQKRMMAKKGANALEYDLQETATLAIPLNLRFSVEVMRMPVRILSKAEKVSSSLLFIIFICC
jgi:hypothetical protein